MSDYLAVDLGATSGRVAIGSIEQGRINLRVIHRFAHDVQRVDGQLLWDWDRIVREVLDGLKRALDEVNPISVAIDSWAVDFGFIDPAGEFIPPVVAYRDERTDLVFPHTVESIGKEKIYSRTGIQFLHFNTIYQLIAAKNTVSYQEAKGFLLLPDLLNYILTGVASSEVTNSSTTQLLNSRTRTWDSELIELVGLNIEKFPALHEPGFEIGRVRGHGELDGLMVTATASHDTAAAIVGVPFLDREREAYISSGTWSLIGVELTEPIINQESLDANLTNELGAFGTVRFLKNVTGLWLLEECRRTWEGEGLVLSISELIAQALQAPTFKSVFNPNDERFAHPGQMPDRIRELCLENGVLAPNTPGEFTICILRSLASAYRDTLEQIAKVSRRPIEVIHVLGGGSQIDLLNQLTADICKIPVFTGPIEATLFGNVMVQAIAAGEIASLDEARSILRNSFESKRFLPS
jgi:rhamnulokinase